MADVEPAIPKSPQQEALPLHQRSPDLNVQPSHQPISVEGKEATIHDFLSLGGIKSASSSVDGAPNVLQSSITTQDLIYPLQKAGGRSNVLPADLVYGNTKPHISSVDYNAGRQTAYILVDDGVEKQPDYRSLDVSHLLKAHGPHDASISKHWQQKKRLSSVVSEDDDDEDDECLDHGYNSKREFGYHKFDTSQQPEGKNMDNKGLTPRSKHSATEQRRRSKINDRFQMLRQLLPYSDQKRDKASFLLEVIEHIQMLHNKVKKYEAAEHLGQPQEKPKAFPWDRASRCKEGVIDMSYGQPVLYNIKDKPDANGYMSYQSSPSRFGHRNGNTQIERTSNGAHASSFPNRLLQAPACLSSYGNSSIINTPAVLTFATRSGIHGEEPTTPTLFPTSSQSLPEPHTMFAQLVHQEEQAESRVKHSHSSEKTIALPDLHQSGISMAAQKSRFLREFDCAKLKLPEQKRPVTHIDRRANDHDMDEQLRSSTVKDLYQRNVNSTSNECEVDKGRTSYGLDGTPMDVNEKRPKEDPRREVVVHSQAQSAVPRGLLNVSSPYSQGLLDSLTQALQRSGVDLSQASISVQIDLGKSNGSAFTSSREIATLNTAMPPSQHSDLGHIQEPEGPITKRPKLEVDS